MYRFACWYGMKLTLLIKSKIKRGDSAVVTRFVELRVFLSSQENKIQKNENLKYKKYLEYYMFYYKSKM